MNKQLCGKLFLKSMVKVSVYLLGLSTHVSAMANFKAGNHVVLMIGFTEFRTGIRTKHIRK